MFPSGNTGIFGMMNQMNAMMNQMMNDPFLTGGHPPLVQQQQLHQQHSTGPHVEEVPQHVQQRAVRGDGPIVEEPDEDEEDEEELQEQQYVPQQRHGTAVHPPARAAAAPGHAGGFAEQNMALGAPMINPFGGLFGSMFAGMPGFGMSMAQSSSGGGGAVYSYSSSSTYSSGPNGTYHSSTTVRQAPGGVRERQQTIRDGRTGHESMTIQRGIGDRERVVSRTRDSSGAIRTHERHVGVDPHAAAEFDNEWVQHAEQRRGPWASQSGSSRQQQQLMLPPAQLGSQQQQQALGYGGGAGSYQAQQQQQHGQQQGGQYGGDGGYQQQHGGQYGGGSCGSGGYRA